jgi:hypothetical protein
MNHRLTYRIITGLALAISTPIITAPVANAATMTAEEQQAKKDAGYLKSINKYMVKLSEAIEAGEGMKATTAAKNAARTLGKLSDEFQASEEVVAIKTSLEELTAEATVVAEKEKQAKSDSKNIEYVNKGLEKMQSALESGDTRTASRELKKAAGYLEKISEETLSTEEMIATQKLFKELEVKVTDASGAADQAEKDAKFLARVKKYVEQTEGYLEGKSLDSVTRSFNNATVDLKLVSEEGLQTKEGIAVKAQYDAVALRVAAVTVAEKERVELSIKTGVQRDFFYKFLSTYKNPIYALIYGKRGTQRDSFLDVAPLKESYKELDTAAATFNENVNLLDPAYEYDGFTVELLKDLLANRVIYRDALVEAVSLNILEARIQGQQRVLAKIREDSHIHNCYMDILYGDEADKPYGVIDEISLYYAWIGKPMPQAKVDELNSYKSALRDQLVKTFKDNKWGKSKFKIKDKYMKDAAQRFADRNDLELLDYALEDKDKWSIKKNELGVPLYRNGKGYVLCQKAGEPFKRGYIVDFKSVYSGGGGYEPISSLHPSEYIIPCK